jgi:hypothetical protein
MTFKYKIITYSYESKYGRHIGYFPSNCIRFITSTLFNPAKIKVFKYDFCDSYVYSEKYEYMKKYFGMCSLSKINTLARHLAGYGVRRSALTCANTGAIYFLYEIYADTVSDGTKTGKKMWNMNVKLIRIYSKRQICQ